MASRPDPDAPALRSSLLRWYRRQRRDLPWRRSGDPYRTWVSEVMLQQTTVSAVIPYYERFLARFPDVATLAAAAEEDVLAAWSGLGYYRRARNLHAGARHVLARHQGRFPDSLGEALEVPGVGPYTARAVLSIAYGQPLGVVDGNVRRVLARVLGRRRSTDRAWQTAADALVPRHSPGDWNQAVMELGATVCTPRAPRCSSCPVKATCRAREAGHPERFPAPRPRRATVDVTVAAAVARDGDRVLVVRRPAGPLMSGLWELPQTPLDVIGDPATLVDALRRRGLPARAGAMLSSVRHAITFRRLRVDAYSVELRGQPALDPEHLRFVSLAEMEALPMSSLSRKIVRALP